MASPADATREALAKVFKTYSGFTPAGHDMIACLEDFHHILKDRDCRVVNDLEVCDETDRDY